MDLPVLTRNLKLADYDDNFELWAFAPCYKYEKVCAPAYYIDDNTGEDVGQELMLIVFPDGTLEPIHHSLFIPELNKSVKLSIDDVRYARYYVEQYLKD